MKKFIIRFKETGKVLAKFSTKERGEAELAAFIADDRLNKGSHSADMYEVVEEDAGMVLNLSIEFKDGRIFEKNVYYVKTENACLYYTGVVDCEEEWLEQIEVPFMQIKSFKAMPIKMANGQKGW